MIPELREHGEAPWLSADAPVGFRGQSWRREAACRGHDSGPFFSKGPAGRALAVCEGCPVRSECLDFAMGDPAAYSAGVWGATTPARRRQLAPPPEAEPVERVIPSRECACVVCGSVFDARSVRARFCSRRCKAAVNRREGS